MIEPCWALPPLGIAGLSARDLMGYCIISLLPGGIVIYCVFLTFPLSGFIQPSQFPHPEQYLKMRKSTEADRSASVLFLIDYFWVNHRMY